MLDTFRARFLFNPFKWIKKRMSPTMMPREEVGARNNLLCVLNTCCATRHRNSLSCTWARVGHDEPDCAWRAMALLRSDSTRLRNLCYTFPHSSACGPFSLTRTHTRTHLHHPTQPLTPELRGFQKLSSMWVFDEGE